MRFYSKEYKDKQRKGVKKKWFAWYPVQVNDSYNEPSIVWLEFVFREYDPIGNTKYWYYQLKNNYVK